MSLESLKSKINSRDAGLAVIGLGYVGLPVACSFAEKGFDVLGVDILTDRIEKINRGVSPIEGKEPGLAELVDRVVGGKLLRATSDYAELADRDIVLISVETPVDEDNKPRYRALESVLRNLGPVLKDGALVIIESTIAPGTMKGLVAPIVEETSGKSLNTDFYLGNCPERVMPGRLLRNLREMSRVVGGMSPETAEVMVDLYAQFVEGDLDPTDSTTAELVKTAENAYRDVQIAFANEVALISQAVGGDVWKVRELVNKSPGRNMLLPGAGVGGHCIPKDGWLLAYGAEGKDVPIRLIPAAREINEYMPVHVADMLRDALADLGKKISDSRILILGYSYLENSDDTRDTPSEKLVADIEARGAEVFIHDPYVEEYQGELLTMALDCDAAVLMVKHDEYLTLDFDTLAQKMRADVFIDARGLFASHSDIPGFSFDVIGRGTH
jgi:UDP-N-acetyl-D-mannosaminuronic acid dehydrogenase